jgi:hypothetical protein
MSRLAFAIAICVVASSSAVAQSTTHRTQRTTPNSQQYIYSQIPPASVVDSYSRPGDPYGVYSRNGTLIGRDPDPNIRQRLETEYYTFGPGSW